MVPIVSNFFYSEIQGSTINSENLWNDWFTVNTVTKFNAFSKNETTPQETPQAMNLPLASDLVLKAICARRETSEKSERTKR